MNPSNVLEVKGLKVSFRTADRQVDAVKGIDFNLGKGETLGIVGESGSGKSVSALSLMRLIPSPPGEIKSGEIMYRPDGQEALDLLKVAAKDMRKYRGNEIAMIFQEPMTSLNPVFKCGSQVTEAILQHQNVSKAEAKEQTIELFKKVKLPRPEQMFDAYPHQISGGQKQRVMIAMAMSCNPSILIADEPTTALDVTVQKEILALIRELQEANGMSVIFITHDLGVISEIADRVLVMYKGNIVEQGTVDQVFHSPGHPYTKGLLACRPRLDRRMKTLPTIADFMDAEGNAIHEEEDTSLAKVIASATAETADYRKRQEDLAASAKALQVSGLKTWYPVRSGLFGRTTDYVKAVDEVSFEVFEGETMGLVGESGCGKTTLGRTIVRLIDPTDGKITYQGNDITTISQREMRPIRKEMQIIFQDPYSSLNPRMTVGNAILEPMKVHKLHGNDDKRRKKVNELLEAVGLNASHYSRFPHEFSGGQRQRVCIARALAVEPKFIVCDESVSALDVSVQAQVLNLLNDLKREFKLTYIFISHDLSVVKFMSDRMIVMNEGKIEEMGFAEDIYADPQSDYTRKLIEAIPKGIVN